MSYKIKDGLDAQALVNAALYSHVRVWEQVDSIEDVTIRMNPPYNSKDLKEMGLDWVNNWAYGKGKMFIERTVSDSVRDISMSANVLDIQWEQFDKTKHKKKSFEFLRHESIKNILARKISSVFLESLEEDPRYIPFLSNIEYNTLNFGFCFVARDEFSYLGYPIHKRNIAFEDRVKLSTINTWITFDVLKSPFLYEKAESNSRKWKVDNIKTILEKRFHKYLDNEKGTPNPETYTWEDIQTFVSKRGSNWLEVNTDNVYIAKIYQLLEGKLHTTYLYLNENVANREFDYTCASTLILYQSSKTCDKKKAFNFIKEFSVTTSDFLHDISGVSLIVAENSLRFDKKKNSVEDKLLINSSPMFNETSNLSKEKASIAVAGGYVVVPNGLDLIPNQVRFDVSSHTQSIQMDEQEFQREIFHYAPSLNLTSRPTKDEVRARNTEVSDQKGAKMPVKLQDYSSLFTNIFHDISKEKYESETIDNDVKKEFFRLLKECLDVYGIKESEIKDILSAVVRLKLRPVITDIQAIQDAIRISGTAEARYYLYTCYLLAQGFSRREINLILDIQEENRSAGEAALENAAFYNTAEVVFYNNQDHITHLSIHFAKIDRMFEGIQGGEDPIRAFNYITNAMLNCQKHIFAVEQSPFINNRFDEFAKVYAIFDKRIKILSQEIQRMKQEAAAAAQQGQQSQQQISPEVMQKMEIKRIEAVEKMKRTNAAHEQRSIQKQQAFDQMMAQREREFAQRMARENDQSNKSFENSQLEKLLQMKDQKDLEQMEGFTNG